MKMIACFMATAFSITLLHGQSKIVANITNLKNDKGVCRACLFNSEDAFNGEAGNPFECLIIPVKNKQALAVFQQVPPGNYALFVFHDENNNNKMDKNFLGIPREGYGASKNKLPFAGAPTFTDNKFTITNNTTTQFFIKMRNL